MLKHLVPSHGSCQEEKARELRLAMSGLHLKS